MDLDSLRKIVFLHPPIKPRAPYAVHINLGQLCNMGCIYCWHRDPLRRPIDKTLQEKVGYDLKKFIDHLSLTGVKTVEIVGAGEPLLFKDTLKTMKYIKKTGLTGHLFTNGLLFNTHSIEELIDINWDCINFSFDTPNQELFSRLKGSKKELFSKIQTNVLGFAQKKKTKHSNNPHIRLSYVVNRLNFNFIEEFIDLAISLSVNSIFFQRFYQFPFNEDLRLSEKEEGAAAQQIHKNMKKLKKYNIGVSSYFESPDWPVRKSCLVPWLVPSVACDGMVYSCCRIQEKMGDLKENTLKEIWEGEKYNRIRERIRERDWFKVCKDCCVYTS